MKYQEGLDSTKNFLKNSPEPTIREVCEKAGLTEKETEMIVQKFRKGKRRFQTAFDMGMCESRFSIKMTRILQILKQILIKLGFLDETFF